MAPPPQECACQANVQKGDANIDNEEDDPDPYEQQERGQRRDIHNWRRHHRGYVVDEVDEQPPPACQTYQDLKINAPCFVGKVNPEAYTDWEKRVDHIFDYYDYPGPKKVALVVAQLTDYVLS